jgi:glycine/D-amino acid oxidase-like deaminating enzyme
MSKKVIVVGAGIIGASLAYHLAKAGAEVRVLDTLEASGGVATPHSWAWINASWGNDADYVKLRLRAIKEWRGLAVVHPELLVNWCGGLLWDLPEAELKAYAASREGLKLLDQKAIEAREPALAQAPDFAVYAAQEGMVEPVTATRGFLAAAISLGAEASLGVEVRDFVRIGDRITGIRTSENILYADEIVLAAGVQSLGLMRLLGISLALDAIPGLLVHSKPAPHLLNSLVMAPKLHVRQTAEGRLVVGSDFGGAQPGDDPATVAANLFDELKLFLRESADLKMAFYTLGHRPTPRDGLPAIGRPRGFEGVYLATMHSGITLAPIVGLFGAREILSNDRDCLLLPYDPNRLIS